MKKIFLIVSLLLTPFAANAADQCNAANVGRTQCMSSRECECKFFRKSEMAGTPDRFSWDCSLLRPNCGSDTTSILAPNNTPVYNGPSSVGISNSRTDITASPVTTNTNTQAQSPTTNLQQQQQSPTTTNTSTTTQSPAQTSTQTNSQNSSQTNN